MDQNFKNQVALVTGGSFGIGRSTAVAFAKRGANVVIVDWMEDKEQTTLNFIKKEGSEGLFIQCDVSQPGDVKAMIEKVIETFGRLDFAFNNAGIEGVQAAVHECTEENWDKTMAVNLKGVWLCMKEEISQMRKQGKGAIINCASIAGLAGFVNLPAYTASKHGIIGLTKVAALENAILGIRVNAVCPGVVHTKMLDRITKEDKEIEKKYIALEPVGRMGEPDEIAEAVVWLSSDAASFVTGHSMVVDGGFMAG
jgi:NAD(P)-dependent dehydrogenase (short-subunit alcohol dehydrogenase family)